MTKDDVEKVIKHLNEKWSGRKCHQCGTGDWEVQDRVFELRQFNESGLIVGGVPLIPVVPIMCGNCGNTILINALKVGVVQRSTTPPIKYE